MRSAAMRIQPLCYSKLCFSDVQTSMFYHSAVCFLFGGGIKVKALGLGQHGTALLPSDKRLFCSYVIDRRTLPGGAVENDVTDVGRNSEKVTV